MSSDRTEKATPRRREDARKKGQLARGPKLPAATGFLAALLVMRITGNDWLEATRHTILVITGYIAAPDPLTTAAAHRFLIDAVWQLALIVLPVISSVMVASLAGNFVQDGFSITADALAPKWERLNPASNFKRVFSGQAVVELLKSTLELGVICIVCYGVVTKIVGDAPSLLGQPPSRILASIGLLSYDLGIRIGGVLLLFAFIDYGYKWYSHEKSLRMTRQEVKEEFKSQEGDPLVKSQRRKSARSLIQQRISVEVPRADVVITNPTHFAVALRYDRQESPAPVVVAKGADHLARRIIELARSHDVAVVQNPPLARALYRDVAPGQSIPPEFFRVVAEVLAFVYRQRQSQGH